MKKLVLFLAMLPMLALGQTLEECQQAAENNYPLQLTVSNIQKGWLPQVSASAQATYQSDVMAWPDGLKNMLSGMGVDVKGLKKDQYRVGIDLQQTVYDGGVIGSQKRIAREQGKVQEAQNEVNIYNVRKRVNEMYFGLLLLEEQIKLNNDLQNLLVGNESKLESMAEHGTAAESDLQNVKAERLNAVQKATELASQKQMLQRMLGTFCGIEIKNVQKPQVKAEGETLATVTGREATLARQENRRPELRALDAQIGVLNAQEKALNAALMPKVGVFAQGYYGYPGLNMFEGMTSHKWNWYGTIGARITWNIGALYTRKNDKAKLQLQRDMTENKREEFLFNNNLEQIQQNENIERYQKLMAQDGDIISLRQSVRKAAESKLTHGVIDVNDLVREINQEHAACVQQSVHEIEMLKEIYDNKYTTNN